MNSQAGSSGSALALEAQRVIDAHVELGAVLRALDAVSAQQTELTSIDAWADVLERKQQLLDAVDARDLATLGEQSRRMIDALAGAGSAEMAQRVRQALDENHRLLKKINEREAAIRQAVRDELHTAHDSLTALGQQQKLRHAYGQTPGQPTPRFYSGRR